MALNDQAFSYAKRQYIISAIQILYNRTKIHFRHGLTHDDVFELLVHPKDREVLKRVAKITNAADHTQHISVPYNGGIHLGFSIPPDKANGFLVPNYASKGAQKNISAETREKINKVVEYSTKQNYDWRLVQSVFDALCNRCTAPAQIKFFMPTIVSLFRVKPAYDGAEGEDDFADRLYSMATPKNIPAMDPLLRKAAIDVGTTVTRGFMMSDKSTEPVDAITMTVSNTLLVQTVPWTSNTELSILQ